MTKQKVEYYVNGFKSTVWSRLRTSKVFMLCLLFMAYQVQKYHAAYGTPNAIPGHVLFNNLCYGVFGILIRSAVAKVELASNAVNPAVKNVEAITVPAKSGFPILPIVGLFLVCCCVFLPACSGTKLAGQYCFTDANGNKVCLGSATDPGTAATALPVSPPPAPPPPPILPIEK